MKVLVALVAALCTAVLAMQAPAAVGRSHLKVGYYNSKCRGVEDVVKYHVAKAIEANRKNGAALVRLIFHDCFVRVRTQSFTSWTASQSFSSWTLIFIERDADTSC
jgi:peroxidase